MGAEQLGKNAHHALVLKWTLAKGVKFTFRRDHDETGFQSYFIENHSRKDSLRVPRFLFELFRSSLQSFVQNKIYGEDTVDFKGKLKFRFERNTLGIKIEALPGHEGAQGQLLLTEALAQDFSQALFDPRINHGSDVLGRILAYHRLFKFTFSEGSESLNSGLALRTDVLSQVEIYVPPVGRRAAKSSLSGEIQANVNAKNRNLKQDGEANIDLKSFKSRLGERVNQNEWVVDYQALFGNADQKFADRQPKVNSSDQGKREGGNKHVWSLPLMASEVKLMKDAPLRCELSAEDIAEMRDVFLTGADAEYFLGFEIIDVIFKSSSGQLKTFRFPLYYTPVHVLESGRQILLQGSEGTRFYLNHLALATMVESFTDAGNVEGAVEKFFKTLLSQKVEHDGRLGRVYLSREFPVAEEIFVRSREILLGHPGENGKGGLISELKIIGAECDSESVSIYKSSKKSGALQKSLEHDLEIMQEMADRSPEKFVRTLPGRFLSRSAKEVTKSKRRFAEISYTPFYRPPSTRRLMERLDHHDVVLLEGPPGTGKTFTIMNLLIHAVCSGQRVLIVSDQEAALHALNEKIEEFLGRDSNSVGLDPVSLWQSAAKLVDSLKGGHTDLSVWCRTLEESLGLSQGQDYQGFLSIEEPSDREFKQIDQRIQNLKKLIFEIMNARVGPRTDLRHRVSPKRGHATTVDDIEAFVEFLKFMGGYSSTTKSSKLARSLIREFVMGREYLSSIRDHELYEVFMVPGDQNDLQLKYLAQVEMTIQALLKLKPKSTEDLRSAIGMPDQGRVNRHLFEIWSKIFPPGETGLTHALKMVRCLVQHPGRPHLLRLLEIVRSHIKILRNRASFGKGVWRQLQIIHEALSPNYKGVVPLSLEVCRFATSSSFTFGQTPARMNSIQEILEEIQRLDQQRNGLVRQRFIARLSGILRRATASENGTSSVLTSLSGMIHGLKSQESLDLGSGIWKELQEKLFEAFPIWLVRKQAVSFLFPCKAKLFDLVIVDEATQCRVDDALPLMLRARKFMVVGDDKQTVLAKNSVIDDYLFAEFNLDEHLRSTQARGIKGGGSHIFGLVKGIKEASVMLDEHYRCPPDIIEYSNRYVYNSDLRIMQWRKATEKPAMRIDWSEKEKPESERAENGQFKGIETDMVDRFLVWVADNIRSLEKELGRTINVETDVAIVYFLLKNEPYIKSKKSEWLQKLDRGQEILDGAGAALQGKERPFIFYLWDVNRGNMMAFKQGDDPDKRKGELNVLMSRPKKRSYHYLHKHFDDLDHEKASITDFLWKAWKRQQEGEQKVELTPRKSVPGVEFFPWRRSSGQLMDAVLEHVLTRTADSIGSVSKQTSVVVGDPRHKVDLVITPKKSKSSSVGVIDLCGFDWHEGCAEDIVDYYFQLSRAEPKIKPFFVFIHELADPRSRGFHRLRQGLLALRGLTES